MGKDENGYHALTVEDLIRETVSNFESLEGIALVEWAPQPPYATFQELVRVRSHNGNVMRLAISTFLDEEEEQSFDDAFLLGQQNST